MSVSRGVGGGNSNETNIALATISLIFPTSGADLPRSMPRPHGTARMKAGFVLLSLGRHETARPQPCPDGHNRRRRRLLPCAGVAVSCGCWVVSRPELRGSQRAQPVPQVHRRKAPRACPKPVTPVSLFLCGDVMLGRAIDQILPHPSAPEPVRVLRARCARLSEARRAWQRRHPAGRWRLPMSGAMRWRSWSGGARMCASSTWRPASPAATRARPRASTTACTRTMRRAWRPPASIAACWPITTCWTGGVPGLAETLATLRRARIASAGAGADLAAAQAPAVLRLPAMRACWCSAPRPTNAGVPAAWAAGGSRAGVHRLPDLSAATVARVAAEVRRHKRDGDRVVFSVHWGGNWDYAVPPEQRAFAHGLIDEAGVDVVHGHSSHHVKAIEVYRDRLILYGCGDFLNDYEGIEGNDEYRGELGLMYFPVLEWPAGRLLELELVPTRIHRFRVNRAGRCRPPLVAPHACSASAGPWAATSKRARKAPSPCIGGDSRVAKRPPASQLVQQPRACRRTTAFRRLADSTSGTGPPHGRGYSGPHHPSQGRCRDQDQVQSPARCSVSRCHHRIRRRACTASIPPTSTARATPAPISSTTPTARGASRTRSPTTWIAGAAAGNPARSTRSTCATSSPRCRRARTGPRAARASSPATSTPSAWTSPGSTRSAASRSSPCSPKSTRSRTRPACSA